MAMGGGRQLIIRAATTMLTAVTSTFSVPLTLAGASSQAFPDDFAIALARSACFGSCPVYSVAIDAKGNVTYEGKKFVRVEGRQIDRVPLADVAALAASVDRIRVFELEDSYREIRTPDGGAYHVTDRPTTIVTVTRGGRSKQVIDYLGAPEGLKALERQIDDIARTRRWIRFDAPILKQMIKDGWSPSPEERTKVFDAALSHDDVDVVAVLISTGIDPNQRQFGDRTPLMMIRSAAAARLLLDAGASPNAKDEDGLTPLGWAAQLAPEVTELLLKGGSRVNESTSKDGETPLWFAACEGNVGVVQMLLDHGADPNLGPPNRSLLQCVREHQELARLYPPKLLEFGLQFDQDFDRVRALIEQALANGKRQ